MTAREPSVAACRAAAEACTAAIEGGPVVPVIVKVAVNTVEESISGAVAVTVLTPGVDPSVRTVVDEPVNSGCISLGFGEKVSSGAVLLHVTEPHGPRAPLATSPQATSKTRGTLLLIGAL
jgi:hypothetical protein